MKLFPPCARSSELAVQTRSPDRRFPGHDREFAVRLHHAAGERSHRACEQDAAGMGRPHRGRDDRQATERLSQHGGPHLLRNPSRSAAEDAGLFQRIRHRNGQGRWRAGPNDMQCAGSARCRRQPRSFDWRCSRRQIVVVTNRNYCRLAKRQRRSLASERETSELREQFIAVLGHDLRNPLASISAGARIIGRDAKTEKEHQVVAMMQTTVMRMAGLIDNVLDFARGRLGGGIALDRNDRAPLEPVLHQVIDELRLSSPGRKIDVDYAIEAPVDCDRSRIGQLVSNLVGNALSHGSANEPVRVRAETIDGLFRFSVANGGEPIPEAAMEKLFEPFFRGEVRASRQGLGLGLHIASQIAKAHNGVLSVTSTPEETRFTFEMPLR